MQATAKLRLARVSARKARLVADLIRGKDVGEALEILRFTRKKSASLFKGLVESAVANAEHHAAQADEKLDIDQLVVKDAYADEGPRLRRWRPRAHGRATKVLKKTAHLTVVVDAEA
jgi:large subunit ribosomal protein L22